MWRLEGLFANIKTFVWRVGLVAKGKVVVGVTGRKRGGCSDLIEACEHCQLGTAVGRYRLGTAAFVSHQNPCGFPNLLTDLHVGGVHTHTSCG